MDSQMKEQSLLGELTQATFGLPEAQNLLDYIEIHNTDEGFEPAKNCRPTKVMPGGMEKADILAKRLERSEELWHEDDPRVERPVTDYEFLIGAMVEVEDVV
jgi:hypothetical protein